MSLVLSLALALQVQAEVNKQNVGVTVSVRPPRERIAVTEEHRRTAFKDATAKELLLRARDARLQQDSSLLSYDVKSYQRISAGMSIRETARDRLIFRTESAAHVRWHRKFGAQVEVLGARAAVPIIAGIDDASDEIQDDIGDVFAVPYYPGKDELWLFDNVGGTDDDGDGVPMLIHPVAEGSEAYFTFVTGDSVLMTLPDGKRITLREILVIPREPRWNLVVGSFWFETAGAHLVRAVMRFSEPMDIWEQVEAEDPSAKEDVPVLVRGLISPMKAEITAVTIEYGLFEQRFWLPRTQGAEGYARVSFMRVPFKVEERYRYNSVNAIDSLPTVPAAPWSTAKVHRDSLKAAGLDSSEVTKQMRAYYAERDSINVRSRREQCAQKQTYTEIRYRYDSKLPMAIEISCDPEKLRTSAELPKSIYDEGEELFGAKERAELMEALDMRLQPSWSPRAPRVDWGLAHTRFNRVEGFGTGATLESSLGKGYTVSLGARASTADLQLNGELGIARSNGRNQLRGALYRRLAVSSDFGDPLSFGASFNTIMTARDEGFYHRAWGGELTGTRPMRGGLTWRLFAEQQWNAPVETRWSLFGGANDETYVGNVAADKAWLYGAGVRWRGSKGLNPQGWRANADVRLEGATGDFEYGRAFLETTVSRGLGPVAASLTGSGGTTTGTVPAQRQFFLGGLQSVRGQTAGTGVGESFWLGRLEIGANQAAVRPLIFGDIGWAGARNDWGRNVRPMSGVGVGASFLDGIMRIDLSRGIYPTVQTRLDFYFEARF